jgi:hypothetical protein
LLFRDTIMVTWSDRPITTLTLLLEECCDNTESHSHSDRS